MGFLTERDRWAAAERAQALFERGVSLRALGDDSGAMLAFCQVIGTGDPDQAPRAWVEAGLELSRHGHREQALTAYRQAIASGHPTWAERARRSVQTLSRERTLLDLDVHLGFRQDVHVTVTDRRFVCEDTVIAFDEVRQVTRWADIRTASGMQTWADRRFALVAAGGAGLDLSFSGGGPNSKQATHWRRLAEIASELIEPRLSAQFVQALAQGVVATVTWLGGSLVISRDGLTRSSRIRGEHSIAWPDFRSVRLEGGKLWVRYVSERGAMKEWQLPYDVVKVANGWVMMGALAACARSLGPVMSAR